MQPWSEAADTALHSIDFLLTDVDDTLTHDGRLESETLAALETLQRAGITVIPVTAASAGWASLIASMLPVASVIAENGGLSFEASVTGLHKRYFDSSSLGALAGLGRNLAAAFPDLQPSMDAPYRETTLAFKRFASEAENARVLSWLKAAGAGGTVNSLWLLAWPGTWNKLEMAKRVLDQKFSLCVDQMKSRVLYAGDSLNDEVMFKTLPLTVGVSTVPNHNLTDWPAWITDGPGGRGFVEVAEKLVALRRRR
jgi:hydroxymethylpyrimidine pyrophosphatase-like HAD family hydrolase